MAFRSIKDVDNWLAGPSHHMGMLRAMVQCGDLVGEDEQWVKAFLVQYDELSAVSRVERDLALQERAAAAAERQAIAAEKAVTRANLALWISVASAALAAWAFVEPYLTGK